MKVLLLNDSSTPSGGAELMTLSLRDGFRLRGHDARLFSSTAKYGNQEPQADYTCYGTTGSLRTLNRVFNLSAYWQLRKTLKDFQPDIVHVRMFLSQLSPLILPLLREIPCLYHAPWYETVCPTGLKLLPDHSVCRETYGYPCLRHRCVSPHAWVILMSQLKLWRQWKGAFNVVVTNSHAVKETFEEHDIGPVKVIWNGVEPRNDGSTWQARPTVVYAGRLAWEKGLLVLTQAFAKCVPKIPDAQLLIAGEGPIEKSIRDLIAELGISENAKLLGHLTQDEIDEQFSGAWVQALPSLTPEPFASSAIEGMMRGHAIIASNLGGFPEIIDDGISGHLIEPNDVDAWANALYSLLDSPDTTRQMGQAGRNRALQKFDRESCIENFLELYREIA